MKLLIQFVYHLVRAATSAYVVGWPSLCEYLRGPAVAIERMPCESVGPFLGDVRAALRSGAYAAVVAAVPAWVRLTLGEAGWGGSLAR